MWREFPESFSLLAHSFCMASLILKIPQGIASLRTLHPFGCAGRSLYYQKRRRLFSGLEKADFRTNTRLPVLCARVRQSSGRRKWSMSSPDMLSVKTQVQLCVASVTYRCRFIEQLPRIFGRPLEVDTVRSRLQSVVFQARLVVVRLSRTEKHES